MSRLIIIIQEKGGVAKTFLAIQLTSYLRGMGFNYRPVDFDMESGLLTRAYPDSAKLNPSVSHILSGESHFPSVMMKVLAGDLFLFDCGANTGMAWHTIFNETWPTLLDELAKAEVKLTVIVPVENNGKALKNFERYKATFAGATQLMVIKRRYPDEKFSLPDHPAELTFDLPLAPARLLATMEDRGMSVAQVATSADQSLAIERGHAHGYLPRLNACFDKIKPYLIP